MKNHKILKITTTIIYALLYNSILFEKSKLSNDVLLEFTKVGFYTVNFYTRQVEHLVFLVDVVVSSLSVF